LAKPDAWTSAQPFVQASSRITTATGVPNSKTHILQRFSRLEEFDREAGFANIGSWRPAREVCFAGLRCSSGRDVGAEPRRINITTLFRIVSRYVGNLAPMPGVFPDYQAPIVRNWTDGREPATVSSTESGMVSPSVGVHLKNRRQSELQGDIENG
jgi:hypothetical protein